jgi:hypothetical protein
VRRWVLLLALTACNEDPVAVGRPPSAFAGFEQRARVGQEVALDGTLSADPDGDPLRFQWRMVARPGGSSARLDPEDEALTRFVPDVAGAYVVSLSVSDGERTDHDLLAVTAAATSTAPEPLRLTLAPAACNVAFAAPAAAGCADPRGGVAVAPDQVVAPATPPDALRTEWRFARVPPGVDAATLPLVPGPGAKEPVRFTPPRPGAYWLAARLVGRQAASAPAYATVHVFDDDAPRAEARIEGPAQAGVRARVILDGRGSLIPTSTAPVQYTWWLQTDPSGGTASLADRATGCPPGVCQRLIPTVAGVYVVGLELAVGTATGAPALFTLEVSEESP